MSSAPSGKSPHPVRFVSSSFARWLFRSGAARVCAAIIVAGASGVSKAQTVDSAVERRFMINEYRVTGAHSLPRLDVESAVYSFLGPDRTERDIERARVALERAYTEAGFQTVGVSVPPQNISGGIVELRVIERPVGRLRVKGAKYSSPQKIKSQAPSVAEGKVINFNEVPGDLAALNTLPDRRVTPALQPGQMPDTVDVNLEVQDENPFHASVELNNRNGPSTEPLRANASISANNLAQSGNSLGFSFQTSPQAPDQVKVFSGYFLLRSPQVDWINLLVQGTKQDSNVSTLGGSAVAGRGNTVGARLLFNLPPIGDYTQSATFGVDYKHFDQTINLPASGTTPANTLVTPITYYPLVASYAGTWQDADKKVVTEVGAGVSFHLRGLGSNDELFNASRYNASGSFIIFQADLSHTREIGAGFQVFGSLHGQLADQPLLSGEQIAGGGLGTVRGYHEAEVVGDSGAFGTLELRSPSLVRELFGTKAEWRLIAFADAGWLKVINPLPDQKNHFDLASYGIGTRFRLSDQFMATLYASMPLLTQGETPADELRVLFSGTLNY